MQLTERFKLYKIESSDFFLPKDLNDRTDQIEEALRVAHAGAVEEHDQRTSEAAALDQRVTALEAKKVVVGSYMGELPYQNAQWRTIELGFTPIAIFVADAYSGNPEFSIPGFSSRYLKPVENGFQVHNSGSAPGLNYESYTYLYIAFG